MRAIRCPGGGLPEQVWQIAPGHPPRVLRRCPRCNVLRPFECSERFRVNAHHRRLDVWLIYWCAQCGVSWNCTVFERINVASLDRSLLHRFHANDRAQAWEVAFDSALLARAGVAMEPIEAFEVHGKTPEPGSGPVRMIWSSRWPLGLRLDRLLAAALGVSRNMVSKLVREGRIEIPGDSRKALRRPVTTGDWVILDW